jgi:hypothetical protein
LGSGLEVRDGSIPAKWAMLVPACIALSSLFKWKKAIVAWIHIHSPLASAWNHAGGVKKISDATPKQTPKHHAFAKSNRPQLQSFGTLQNATPTQRERKGFWGGKFQRRVVCGVWSGLRGEKGERAKIIVLQTFPLNPCL